MRGLLTGRRVIAVGVLALMASMVVGCGTATGADLEEGLGGKLPWPDSPVAAAIATKRGQTILSNNDEYPMPLASTAKLVTALVVLEKHPLKVGEEGPEIEITAEHVALTDELAKAGGSTLSVGVGGKISERSLIAGALVESANNYAEILVSWAFGSDEEFLEQAKTWLREQGCSDTTLADATGLDVRTQGTASDLVRIGQASLANEVVADMVSQSTVSVQNSQLENTNALLKDPSFIGLKTGNLGNRGHTLAFARTADPENPEADVVVGAVLGEKSAGFARKHAEDLTQAALAALESAQK